MMVIVYNVKWDMNFFWVCKYLMTLIIQDPLRVPGTELSVAVIVNHSSFEFWFL